MTQGGYGVTLTVNAIATVNIDEIDELQLSKFISESTGHDSTAGYYEAVATGKFRAQPFTVGVWWDSTAHAGIVTQLASTSSVVMIWADPDGDETITFNGFVEMIGRVTQQEGTYRANLTIHPTGQAVIT